MTTISTKIMPPILEYSYPSFPYNQTSYSFQIKMSVINDYDSFNYIELRAGVADSNNEGFNAGNDNIKALDPANPFIKIYKIEDTTNISVFGKFSKTLSDNANSYLTVQLSPYLLASGATDTGNGSIFNLYSGSTAIPTNFKIQCRLGIKTSLLDEVSEWSNAAIVRLNTGILINVLPTDNLVPEGNDITVSQTSILWKGAYSANGVNSDELVNQYSFLLTRGGATVEDSGELVVGEYEIPTFQYRFRTPLENTIVNGQSQTPYNISFSIETNYGYLATITKTVHVNVPYQRTYDIFDVNSNDEDAYNSISIDAKERFVMVTQSNLANSIKNISDTDINNYFLKDSAMLPFEPDASQTHLRMVPLNSQAISGKIIPDYNLSKNTSKFQTSDNGTLTILIAVKNLHFSSTIAEAMEDNNLLFRINQNLETGKISANTNLEINQVSGRPISKNALDIKVGLYQNTFIWSEELFGLKNIYKSAQQLTTTDEYLFIIQKNTINGDLYVETNAWQKVPA